MDGDTTTFILFDDNGAHPQPKLHKLQAARALIQAIAQRIT